MPLILRDRVQETTTTLGTGTITLAGALSGFQSFSVIGNGNTTYYTIVSQTSNEWEVGIGTYTSSGTTLSRDTVLESSNGGSLVNFSAGTKNVFVTYPAEKSVYKDASEDVTLPDTLTAATVAIDAPTTDATFTNDTGITGWVYSGKGFSVNAQESAPTGLFFKPDGTKMYVTGSSGDDVNEYNLGTAWDVTTASFVAVSTGITQDTSPQDLFFKDDGLTLFVLGATNDTVYQYTLSVAWDITTATYASKSFSVATQEGTPAGIWFKSDGTTMYIVGTTNDTVYQYTLSTPWDVSTASYASISFSVAAQESNPQQVVLSADGTKMWILGTTGDDINEYTLGTAWNISTATFVNNVYVGFQESTPTGLFIDSTAVNRVYIVGQVNDTVYQYNTATNTVDAMTDRLFVSGEGYVDGNFVAGSNANIDGNITASTAVFGTTSVSGTLTATSNLTLSGSTTATGNFGNSITTGNISMGTGQTTGTFIIGATGQTGAITVGQSTGAQTLNIGTGATTNGTTKTINFGTAGVSGSTTNINIGSAVSGALGNISIGNSGTQFLVTPTASAVNYVQVTGAATNGQPIITTTGSDAAVGMLFVVRGTSSTQSNVTFASNLTTTNTTFRIAAGSSTNANFLQVAPASASSGPVLSSQGTDTNIDLSLTTKGTGAVNLNTGNGTAFKVFDNFDGGTIANSIGVYPRGTTFSPFFFATGSATDIGISLVAKAAGNLRFLTGANNAGVGGIDQLRVSHTASAVNYVQVTGAATGGAPAMTVQGSDTNIAFALSSKGTGNINFWTDNLGARQFQVVRTASTVNYVTATGSIASAGPRLSVEGTDTNIDLNLTTKGTGAVKFNTGGGEQLRVTDAATAVNYVEITGSATGSRPSISAQGSDTNLGLQLSSKGTRSIVFYGRNFSAIQFATGSTNSAVNYLQAEGQVTGAGPDLSAQGSDTNIDINLTTKGTGVVNLNTGAGTQVRIIDSGGTAVNRIHLQGQATGFFPVIASRGSDTNLGMSYSTQGTGPHDFYTDGTSFAQQFKVSHTASAVNYVQVTGAATGSEPTISAQGSDSSVSLNLAGKGASGFVQFTVNSILRGRFGASGVVDLGISSSGGTGFQISATTNQVNYLQAAGAIASSGPVLSAQGSDTNIDLNLTPKGTGTVVVNGPLTATSSIQNTRINPRAVAAGATSGSLTINGDTTDLYEAEGLTGAITFLQPSGTPVDGQRLIIRIKDNGTARGITWTTTSGAFRAIGVTLPTTTVLSKVTYVGCIYNATDVFWDVIAAVTQA